MADKIKKISTLLFVNLLILFFLFTILDFACFCLIKFEKKEKRNIYESAVAYYHSILNRHESVNLKERYIIDNSKYRKPLNINSKEDSVVFFVDSFPYGYNLKEEETISYLLAQSTRRPIYNRSLSAANPSHMYYQLQDDDFYKLVNKPKVVFYIYMPVHMVRIQTKNSFSRVDIFYKINNKNLLALYDNSVLFDSYIFSYISSRFFRINVLRELYFKKGENLFIKLLVESKKQIQSHWGDDVEFVVLKLKDNTNKNEEKMFKKLFDLNCTVFPLYNYIDYSNPQHQLPDKHPNALYWQKVAPILIKEFNL